MKTSIKVLIVMVIVIGLFVTGCQRYETPLKDSTRDEPVTVKDPVKQPAAEPAVESCSDGIRNQGEEKTDCGGPCAPCPSCDDGIKNQGEEKTDCGGPCKACFVPVKVDNDPVLDSLMERHSKIKSGYEYDYSYSDTQLERQPGTVDRVSVLEDKIAVHYFQVLETKGFLYNYLFLDNSKEEAYVYCEEHKCKEKNGTAMKVDYDEFKVITPLDRLDSLKKARFLMNQQYDSKECVVLSEDTGVSNDRIWVWEFYGMPLKVEKDYDGRKVEYRYENFLFNKVRAGNVTLPKQAVIV